MELVREVGKAAYVDEFAERFPRATTRWWASAASSFRLDSASDSRSRGRVLYRPEAPRILILDEATSSLGFGIRVARPRGTLAPDGRDHGAGRGAPAGHHRPARSHRGPRPWSRRRAGHPCRALGPHRRLLPVVGAPVGRLPRRLTARVCGTSPDRSFRSGPERSPPDRDTPVPDAMTIAPMGAMAAIP